MNRSNLLLLIVLATGLFAFPLILRDVYLLTLMIFVGIHILVALGLTMLIGFAGQLSLCQAAFYGIGAYTTAVLSVKTGMNPLFTSIVAVLLACLVAFILGMPALKLRGHYLAMATLGFGEIVNIVFKEWGAMTGGPSGLVGIPQMHIGGISVDTDLRYFYFVWIIVLLVVAFLINLANSRVGRGLQALKRSEDAAGTMGIPVARYKIKVFVLSAALAALGGALYAHYVTVISPESFDVFFSVVLVTMVVAGGLLSVWGGVIGASLFTILPDTLQAFEDYNVIIYGFILLFILMFMPKGLAGLISLGVDRAKRLMDRGVNG
ncbi:MAG: branched-chain amino acid ABC transporter permease [Deltaproteobacteria bacterium]|nr:branched-chain amino acid ABC transporter permease [Deltaproteobacteria bacterium]